MAPNRPAELEKFTVFERVGKSNVPLSVGNLQHKSTEVQGSSQHIRMRMTVDVLVVWRKSESKSQSVIFSKSFAS